MSAIAGGLDVLDVLSRLATVRPVFHSEADFQHAFAWEARQLDPLLEVRLELQIQPHKHLDLLLRRPDLDRHTAVELKYPTALWAGEVAGEQFALNNHGARDVIGYDVVKDIARLETVCAGRATWNGFLILVTNEPGYWKPPTHGRRTNADAFRVHDGMELGGQHDWGPNTGPGSMRGREQAINLNGRYRLHWREYSSLAGPRGRFRSLVVEVAPEQGGGPEQGSRWSVGPC